MHPHQGSLRPLVPAAVVFLASAALSPTASGQVASALLREGDGVAGLPGQVVSSLNNTAVNQQGGYSVTVSSSDGVTSLSLVWGNAAGGAGALLRTEATIGMYVQTSFETFFGMDDAGQLAYSPLANDTMSGATSLDGVWLDDTLLCLEGLSIPSLAGKVWRFGSRPGICANGLAYWVGGIDDGTSGANEGNGLFSGAGATVHVKSGDVIAGLPAAISSAGVDFDARFSAQGTHYITLVDTDAASTADAFVLIDGAPATVGGNLLGEGQAIPASSGGLPGELWASFDFFGITEAGDTLFTGDTGGPTATDEFVAKNGVILYREGDTLDGRVLTGSIDHAYMNEAGNIAYNWDVVDGASSLDALYVDDHLILTEGDAVDWDGDGFADPGATITDFTGISALTVGPGARIYFVADVVVSGVGTLEGFFCIRYECLSADAYFVSTAVGGTVSFDLDAGVANGGQAFLFTASTTGSTPGFDLQGFHVPLNPDGFVSSVLVLGMLDADGRSTVAVIVPPLAPSTVGTTVHFAYATFGLSPLTLTKVSGAIPEIFVP